MAHLCSIRVQEKGSEHIEAETKSQMNFVNEIVWISIKISLKFVSKGP